MIIYLATLVLSVILCWKMQQQESGPMLVSRQRSNPSISWYMIFLVLILGVVVSWRNGVGTDYGNYVDIYSLNKELTISTAFESKEPLFGLLNSLCSRLFDDYIPVFVICGFFSCILIVVGIKHSSSQYWLSIFLLITGMYYFDLFNGMRQMIATVMMFAAYPFLVKKKWIPLGIITLIAYGFHASTPIVLVFFIFAAYVRPGSTFMWVTVGLFLVIYMGYSSFADWLISALQSSDSVYANYEESLAQFDMGANFLRFALAAVPVILGGISWKILRKQRKDAGILLNLSLVNALFMLVATRNWIFARFCMFFGIYNILLWPELLKCFEPKSRQLMTVGVICVYFAYFWLIVHTDSNLLPYRSWLFGGVYG